MPKKLVLTHNREGYSHNQATRPMTVGELKDILDQFEDDDEIITFELTNTYCGWGSISNVSELSDFVEDAGLEEEE